MLGKASDIALSSGYLLVYRSPVPAIDLHPAFDTSRNDGLFDLRISILCLDHRVRAWVVDAISVSRVTGCRSTPMKVSVLIFGTDGMFIPL